MLHWFTELDNFKDEPVRCSAVHDIVANQPACFLQFDKALRHFLSEFRLPGEAAQIDRVMQAFSEK